MENNKFKTVCIKNRTCYYIDDIIESEDFDLDNILKIIRNILIHDISYKTLIGWKPLQIRFNRISEILRIYDELEFQYCFALRNMTLFTAGLHIL